MFKSISVPLLTLLAASIVGPSSYADEKKEVLKMYQSDPMDARLDYVGKGGSLAANLKEIQSIVVKLESRDLGRAIALQYNKEFCSIYLKIIAPQGCSQTEFSMIEFLPDHPSEEDKSAFKNRIAELQALANLINQLSESGDFRASAIVNARVESKWTDGDKDGQNHVTLTVTVTTIGPEHVCKTDSDEKVESGKKDNKQAEAPADSQKQNPEDNKQEKQDSGNPR